MFIMSNLDKKVKKYFVYWEPTELPIGAPKFSLNDFRTKEEAFAFQLTLKERGIESIVYRKIIFQLEEKNRE